MKDRALNSVATSCSYHEREIGVEEAADMKVRLLRLKPMRYYQ